MSQLRKQLKEVLPELREEAKHLRDAGARKRWGDLSFIASSAKSLIEACHWRGVSEDYFRKWAKRLLANKSLSALTSESRKPRSSPNKVSKYLEAKVVKLRKSKPFLGADRIKDILNLRVSVSAVYNVLRRKKLISKTYAKRLVKKHLKRYRRPWPGYLQMDFKYVPYLILGKQYYQLSAVDHHSSWRLIRIYPNKDLPAVLDFLDNLLLLCPFAIMEIQTDNDASFTDKYTSGSGEYPSGQHPMDQWCWNHDVRHKLIPIGEKELNGKVENTHRQDDREFFSQVQASTYESLLQLSVDYERYWNEERRTKALGRLTPAETIHASVVRAAAWLSYLKHRFQEPVRKVKHFSLVDRYIKWAEEDAKKWGKYAFAYLTMSKIFSLKNLQISPGAAIRGTLIALLNSYTC